MEIGGYTLAPVAYAHPLIAGLQTHLLPLVEEGLHYWVSEHEDQIDSIPVLWDDSSWYEAHFESLTPWSKEDGIRLLRHLAGVHGSLSSDEIYRLVWEISVNQTIDIIQCLEEASLAPLLWAGRKAVNAWKARVQQCGGTLLELYDELKAAGSLDFSAFAAKSFPPNQKHQLVIFRAFRSVVLSSGECIEEVDQGGRVLFTQSSAKEQPDLSDPIGSLVETSAVLLEGNTVVGTSRAWGLGFDEVIDGVLLKTTRLSHDAGDVALQLKLGEALLTYTKPTVGMAVGVSTVKVAHFEFTLLGPVRAVFSSKQDDRVAFASKSEFVLVANGREVKRLRAEQSFLAQVIWEAGSLFISANAADLWILSKEGRLLGRTEDGECRLAVQISKSAHLALVAASEKIFESQKPSPLRDLYVAKDPLKNVDIRSLFYGSSAHYRQKAKYPATLRQLASSSRESLIELGMSKQAISRLERQLPKLIAEAWSGIEWPHAKVNAELHLLAELGYKIERPKPEVKLVTSFGFSESKRFDYYSPVLALHCTEAEGLSLELAFGVRVSPNSSFSSFTCVVPGFGSFFEMVHPGPNDQGAYSAHIDFDDYRFSLAEIVRLGEYAKVLEGAG